MKWINIEEQKPNDGQQVLVIKNKVVSTIAVASFRKGLSIKEREEMKKQENPEMVPMLSFLNTVSKTPRYMVESACDEGVGNNIPPYSWDGVGPMQYFGQDFTHWLPLESLVDQPDQEPPAIQVFYASKEELEREKRLAQKIQDEIDKKLWFGDE